ILGMDDSHRTASHIAAQVIPAALAVAETCGTSGADLLAAIVAAYELAVPVGHALRRTTRERGQDLKGVVGVLAATVAAGRCAGLDAEQLALALGLAVDMASGTEQYVYDKDGCDTKDLIAGFAARNAVFATRLVQAGFRGPLSGLDGEYGFFRAYGEGYASDMFDDLGRDFAILTTGFKPHGGCRHTHQAVDAVQQILRSGPVDTTDIERVVIGTYRYATEPSFRAAADPATRELAGLSIRVAGAVSLVRHSAWPDDYAAWDAPEVRRLRHITDVVVDPEIDRTFPQKNGCRVTLQFKDGSVREGYVEYAKGEPEFPISEGELQEKFAALTREILPASTAAEIYDRCMALDKLPNVRSLLALAKTPGLV
ncbi:MAG: MmgE/PrpD family protein, partial [Planctomycetes bacterium]|nr:MmgE/PrpD family protein [Planctomycetota bacterium]